MRTGLVEVRIDRERLVEVLCRAVEIERADRANAACMGEACAKLDERERLDAHAVRRRLDVHLDDITDDLDLLDVLHRAARQWRLDVAVDDT